MGWAEVLSKQQIGGTAIFRDVTNVQEAAVPLLTAGGSKLLSTVRQRGPVRHRRRAGESQPDYRRADHHDHARSTGQGHPHDDHRHAGNVQRDGGHIPDTGEALAPRIQREPLNATRMRGVIEFDSPNVPIFALGIRAVNNRAFTSIRALNLVRRKRQACHD